MLRIGLNVKAKTGRAKMPWNGNIAHTKLSDGRVVLRGSIEDAIDKFGEELVLGGKR